ncbi:MAG: carbamoyltransferase HypF [Rhodobacteraceae bacterium]|nr:carbamoyltransferase HypF [Paracoccaceae bacterium]
MASPARQIEPRQGIAAEIALPRPLPPVIGMGAFLKASLAVIDHDRAFVTETAGDLSTLEAVEAYQALLDIALGVQPAPVLAAHDLHPDFHTTRQAATIGCATLAVQHHHAHILATQWEHGQSGPVLGLSLDGFGLGPDRESWGGELLLVDGADYRRLGHFSLLAQPGGDIAARQPWRMAAAALHRLGRGDEIAARFASQPHAALLGQMLDRGINAPETSSCGRLFDAACGLLNLHPVADFEGQAPMALEAMVTVPDIMAEGWTLHDGVLDLSPLLARLVDCDTVKGANLFHGTLAAAIADWTLAAAQASGIRTVAFGGGCFLNWVLTTRLETHLAASGLKVLKPERLSPGDAGLCFGQAIAAALHVERQTKGEPPCA